VRHGREDLIIAGDMSQRTLEQPWPRSAAEAELLQERLRGQVVTEDQLGVVQRVAGVDA
jgi:hypothetical protein